MSGDKIRIGVIAGNESDRAIFAKETIVQVAGNNDVSMVIKMMGDPDFEWTRLHLTPSYFRKSIKQDHRRFNVLWNTISDADQHPRLLKVVERYVQDFKGAVIDPPSQVCRTRRHHIAERLQNLPGVRMPKTLLLRHPTRERVSRLVELAGFRFPAILRATGIHNGVIIALADDIDGCVAVFGERDREFYLTEFIDVRGDDGLYRKTRFFMVGDCTVVRQHIVGLTWNIHGRSSREFMVDQPHLLEEASQVLHGQVDGLSSVTRGALAAIRGAIGMDYFGIDACIMADGSLTVFEVNATMNFSPAFRNPATQYNRAAVQPMIDAVRRLLIRRSV